MTSSVSLSIRFTALEHRWEPNAPYSSILAGQRRLNLCEHEPEDWEQAGKQVAQVIPYVLCCLYGFPPPTTCSHRSTYQPRNYSVLLDRTSEQRRRLSAGRAETEHSRAQAQQVKTGNSEISERHPSLGGRL
jgi:hypothetical protein